MFGLGRAPSAAGGRGPSLYMPTSPMLKFSHLVLALSEIIVCAHRILSILLLENKV